MAQNPVRFVTASSLFDGHDASINIMRRILQAQGAEVIHLGHNRSVAEIADAVVDEDVQGVAISSYQGGHVEFFEYLAETLRQAGRIITGSALVIFGMQMVIGLSVGTEAIYILRGYGAQSYAGVFTAWATIRVTAPLMFGYILAAKVGCGLVAEIGSMRISEEVDAMEVMAIDSMRFLIATRLLGALLALPAIYVIGIACQFLTEYLVVVVQIGEVSGGAWSSVHWQYQNPPDLAYSTITAMTIAVTIVLVGLFYGYRVRGGPVEVGEATARSMVVNLVLIHLIGAVLGVIFWGFSANAPVGG